MLRKLTALTCLLCGAWTLVAVADGRGWTRPLWDRLLPEIELPHQPSPVEAQKREVEKHLAELDQEIGAKLRTREELAVRRRDLLVRLSSQLTEEAASNNSTSEREFKDNPIVMALIKSIAAEDRRANESAAKLRDLRARRDRGEARLIGLQTGTSLIGEVDIQPSATVTEQDLGRSAENYRTILQEALRLSNR